MKKAHSTYHDQETGGKGFVSIGKGRIGYWILFNPVDPRRIVPGGVSSFHLWLLYCSGFDWRLLEILQGGMNHAGMATTAFNNIVVGQLVHRMKKARCRHRQQDDKEPW